MHLLGAKFKTYYNFTFVIECLKKIENQQYFKITEEVWKLSVPKVKSIQRKFSEGSVYFRN